MSSSRPSSAGTTSETSSSSPSKGGISRAGKKLHAAVNDDDYEGIESLLLSVSPEKKSEVLEYLNADSVTPLWSSCKQGFVESAAVLLRHGANINFQSKFGETPAYIASHLGRKSVLELLLKHGADFLTIRDRRGELPIHVACYHNRPQCVRMLLDAGTPVNVQDKDGRTACYVCSYHDHWEILEMLIREGCDVNIARNNGRTPLYCAAAEGNPICLRMLIAFGADVNQRDKQQRTALTASATGYEEIKAILRSAGAEF